MHYLSNENLSHQEFLNLGTFSSFVVSDTADLEATAQPLQKQENSIKSNY